MSCYTPYMVRSDRDGKHTRLSVPCGKCIPCLNAKRSDWTFRIMEEERCSINSTFLTLTYNDAFLPKGNQLDKRDLQKYFKRIRKYAKKLKYFAVGEYGSKYSRPHYHAIIFNAEKELLVDKWQGETKAGNKEPMGIVSCDTVTQASIHYCTKYIINGQGYGYLKRKKEFALMSKGLGKSYVANNKDNHKKTKNSSVQYVGGIRQRMPRYYKNLIFDDLELKEIGELNREKALEINSKISYEKELKIRNAVRELAKRSAKSKNL